MVKSIKKAPKTEGFSIVFDVGVFPEFRETCKREFLNPHRIINAWVKKYLEQKQAMLGTSSNFDLPATPATPRKRPPQRAMAKHLPKRKKT